jgi:hypothetical protein
MAIQLRVVCDWSEYGMRGRESLGRGPLEYALVQNMNRSDN